MPKHLLEICPNRARADMIALAIGSRDLECNLVAIKVGTIEA
jgi:hypothetical protein